jgi:hypothetical protein
MVIKSSRRAGAGTVNQSETAEDSFGGKLHIKFQIFSVLMPKYVNDGAISYFVSCLCYYTFFLRH